MHGVHEHSHGLQLINNTLRVIKRTIDSGQSLDLEELKKDLSLIESGSKSCKDSIDYIYKEIKELNTKKD